MTTTDHTQHTPRSAPAPYDEPPPDPYDEPYGGHHEPDRPAADPLVDTPAERAVLGAMLADPHALDPATSTVTGEHFHTVAHERIFDAAVALYARGRPVDPITVANQLGPTELRKVGGAATLHTLQDGAQHVLDVGYYAQIVADLAARRRLRSYHHRGLQRIEQAGALAGGIGVTPEELRQAALADLEQLPTGVPGVDDGTSGSSWGSADLDVVLQGLIDGTVTGPRAAHMTRRDGKALLYPAAVHSVSGEPGSGKTWVALIAVAQELDAGNAATVLDFEDRAETVVSRLLALGVEPDAIRERFRYVRPDVALTAAAARDLDRATHGATVVVVDGITEAMTMHGLSLMDNEDVARWLALIPRRIADQGPAVLQIDHVVKNAEARGRFAIGGQHKLAGITGVAYKMVTVHSFGKGVHGVARMVIDKDKHGDVGPNGLTVAEVHLDATIDPALNDTAATHGGHGQALYGWIDVPDAAPAIDPNTGGFRPTVYMERVSRQLELHPAGLTGRQLCDLVKGKADHIRTAARVLVEEGYAGANPGANRSITYTHLERFREAADAAGTLPGADL